MIDPAFGWDLPPGVSDSDIEGEPEQDEETAHDERNEPDNE